MARHRDPESRPGDDQALDAGARSPARRLDRRLLGDAPIHLGRIRRGVQRNWTPGGAASADRIVVPWKATVLVPELPADLYRPDIYQALVRFSRSTSGLIGHDCVPLTAAETTEGDMPSVFARYLCFAAHVDRIATTSEASTTEFRGWRAMLAGAGRSGPDIREVRLPTVARAASDEALGEARKLLCVGSMPVVLAVGSHEPRKNHLALVHAAEVLWREGLAFTLAFVGGHAWNSDRFVYEVDALQAINRPLLKIRGLSDDLLWAAYRLAHCTVFPSFHEGFGLPVAESLACGTPVITSNFGSMKQIASGGGALLVDPRNTGELTQALRRMLVEPGLRDALAARAAALRFGSWEEYAAGTWSYLVDGVTAG